MNNFTLYLLIGFPITLMSFIHFDRKKADIDLEKLITMSIVSLIPIIRELVVLFMWIETVKTKNILKMIVFKQYKG